MLGSRGGYEDRTHDGLDHHALVAAGHCGAGVLVRQVRRSGVRTYWCERSGGGIGGRSRGRPGRRVSLLSPSLLLKLSEILLYLLPSEPVPLLSPATCTLVLNSPDLDHRHLCTFRFRPSPTRPHPFKLGSRTSCPLPPSQHQTMATTRAHAPPRNRLPALAEVLRRSESLGMAREERIAALGKRVGARGG